MQLDRKTLAFGQLPSSKGDLYAPSGVKGLVHTIVLHNTNTTDETVVLNYHDGTSEHEIFHQVMTAGETLTWDFRGVGDVVEDGAKYTGNTTTAAKVTLKVMGVEEGPGADFGVGRVPRLTSNLWAPPTTPHTYDDEFEETTLSGWTGVVNVTDDVDGTFSYDTVDAYDTTFTTGNVVRVNVHGERRSWALIQTPIRDKVYSIYKAITLPTNLLVVARMRFNMRSGVYTGNDASVALCLHEATAGRPDVNSRLQVYLNEQDAGAIQAQSWSYSSTGSLDGSVETTDVNSQGQALEYVALHKIGTTYHAWAGTHGGNWMHLNSYSGLDYTPDMVAILTGNASSAAPGACIVGVDFIRFYETDNFLF
jgi:hypothetical protein